MSKSLEKAIAEAQAQPGVVEMSEIINSWNPSGSTVNTVQCSICGNYRIAGTMCWCQSGMHSTIRTQTVTGWECPRCHRIYSPSVVECEKCNNP